MSIRILFPLFSTEAGYNSAEKLIQKQFMSGAETLGTTDNRSAPPFHFVICCQALANFIAQIKVSPESHASLTS